MKKIAVIGGGITGIAAGLTLHQDASCRFQIFESGSRLGGVLETIQDGPYLVEKSADNFATLIPNALKLSQDWGLEDELIKPNPENRQAFVVRRGQLHPIPMGFSLMQPTRILPMLATPTLSLAGKMRALGEVLVPRRQEAGDESLHAFATRRLGKEAYENLVEPIVSGIFTADPNTLSMQATMPQFVAMEKQHGSLIRGHWAAKKKDAAKAAKKASGARYDQFVAPRNGMSHWVEQLSAKLPAESIRLNQPVDKIAKAEDGWRVTSQDGSEVFDGIVLATPAARTAALLQEVAPEAAGIVGSIPYASSVVAAFVVNRQDVSGRVDGFGLISPSKEQRDALAISYSSVKYDGRVPDDQLLLRIFMGGALKPQFGEKPDDEILQVAAKEIRELLGWSGKKANWQAVIRWPHAMPQYLVGHVDRMTQLKQILNDYPSIKLCGAAYAGVGIPQCIRGGVNAATELLAVPELASS